MNLEIMNGGGGNVKEGILLSQYGPAMVCIILLLTHIGIVDVYDIVDYLPLMVFECKSCSDYMGDAIHVRQGVKLNSDKFHDFLTVMYW